MTVFVKRKYIFFFFGLFIILLNQRFLNERQNGLANTIASDGLEYYAYLPAAIIYQDYTYAFMYKKENCIDPIYRTLFNSYNDKIYNKHYCGTAICLLPFFLLGMLISFIAGTDMNGYTDTFLMLVSIAPLIYFLLSVFFITKIAKFFNIAEKTSLIVCFVFFFCTNLHYYVIHEPSMSHAYSFFAVSLFLYLCTKLYVHISTKYLLLLGMSLALVFLLRPVNIIVLLFLPFFSKNFNEFLVFLGTIFKVHFFKLLVAITILFMLVSIQFVFYYLETGSFFIVPYDGESFDFSNPQIINILFSYKKGLFVYTPILFFALLFILFSRKLLYKKTIFLITFLVFLYITSSWWCWFYGGSFGNRPFIDIFPLFIIMLMLLVHQLKTSFRNILLALCVPFLFFNQLMAFQYSNLLMDTIYMNKEKFWELFLETDLATMNDHKINGLLKSNKIIKAEYLNFENDIDNRIKEGGYNSSRGSFVNKSNQFSKGFEFTLGGLSLNDSFYIIAECMVKANTDARDLVLVVSVDVDGENKKWDVVFKKQFNEGADGWVKMTKISKIEKELVSPDYIYKIFVNSYHGEAIIDDLKYTIIAQ